MIAVDTNLLVYAHRRDSEWHAPDAEAMRHLAEGPAPWAIPWPCVHEFLAIVTHPRIYTPAGARVHDARIAALCLYHGVRELWSADRDFSRFMELTVKNPLVG